MLYYKKLSSRTKVLSPNFSNNKFNIVKFIIRKIEIMLAV